MVLVSAIKVNKAYGERILFQDVSFDVNDGDKIGLIGANGVGKTTLMNMFTGLEKPDGGQVFVNKDLNVGYMRQHVPSDFGKTMYQEAMGVFSHLEYIEIKLNEIAAEISKADKVLEHLIQKQHRLSEEFERKGGYTYKSRLKSTLMGLGFSESDLELPIGALSGGQRSKVQLARLLLSDAKVLLLDEPTNHLDTESVEWLENFLLQFKGAILVISHDRYFLNRITNKTIELENKKAYVFSGNYSRYIEHKAKELESREHQRVNTLREIKRVEGIITQQKQWNRERTLKTARNKQKMVDRLKEDLPEEVKVVSFGSYNFESQSVSGDDVLFAEDIEKSFGDNIVFRNVNMHIRKGEHVFLLGGNGCGKSTLLKTLINDYYEDYSIDAGSVSFGSGVRVGYYDQTQDTLSKHKTIIDEVWDEYPKLTQTKVRNALAAFLFKGDDVFKTIDVLSGGEKARVALVKLMLSGANFLLLDEPTNHLDIMSREAFEDALNSYDGTLLIVSHDRYLVNKLSHRILYFDGTGNVKKHQGGYDSYLEMKQAMLIEQQDRSPEKKGKSLSENTLRKEASANARRIKARIRRIESDIEECENGIESLETELNQAAADYQRIMEITEVLGAKKEKLEQLYDQWEDYGQELENVL